MSIYEGLLLKEQVQDEMSEEDFDEISFSIEMGCLFFGDTDGAFFSFDDISKCRKLKTAIYPLKITNNKRDFKIPDLVNNERRIMSVDVALMASKKHNNDASSIIINSAIPKNNNSYNMNIIYMENHEGIVANELALTIRRLFDQYKCTDLVLDCAGVGQPIFDLLAQDIIDNETGELYPALSCCNNKEMADRCKVDNAPKVIWAIKASASFNSEICLLLRSGFQNKKINLLVSEFECEEILKDRIKDFKKLIPYEQNIFKMPYIQTTLLIYELINLESDTTGTNIKVKEKSGMRKDRYSSLAYNYWVQCQLERESLRKVQNSFSLEDYAKGFKRLNKRPTIY